MGRPVMTENGHLTPAYPPIKYNMGVEGRGGCDPTVV